MIDRAAAETAFAELLREVDRLLPRTEERRPAPHERADIVADLLAFLARRMQALHEEKAVEKAAFLSWLAQQTGTDLQRLAGKTVVLEYDEGPGVDAVLAVLQRNHPRHVQEDVRAPRDYGARNPLRERLVHGYARSMDRLRPIRLQLELTDRLIDTVVYRLYGLNDEEIAIVERG